MSQRLTSPRDLASRPRIALSGVSRLAAGGLRFAARRPTAVLAGVAVLGGGAVFAWNATMTQTARHPAPLFAGPTPAPVPARSETRSEPPRRAEPVSPLTTGTTRADLPVPPQRPSGPDAIGSIIRAGEAPVKPSQPAVAEARTKPTDARPKSAEVKPKAPEPKKAAETKPAPAEAKPATADGKPAPQPRVASAQKALAKLGYGPIQPDGLLGSTTRQALEKFERDKKLPVTGSLAPATAKQLASLSGITVQ